MVAWWTKSMERAFGKRYRTWEGGAPCYTPALQWWAWPRSARTCHGEQPDPHQHVSPIEQELGTQQAQRVPHPGVLLLGGETDDFQGQIVGEERDEESKEVYPVSPVEEAHRAVPSSHLAALWRLTTR